MENKFSDVSLQMLNAQLGTIFATFGGSKFRFNFEPNVTEIVYSVFIKNLARYLAKYKSKTKRTAIVINDLSSNFIMGMAIDYIAPENEDDEMPGSWELVASFDKDTIIDNSLEMNVKNLQDTDFLIDLKELLFQHDCFQFEDVSALQYALIMYFTGLLETVKNGANNDIGKPFVLKLADMTITGQLENNKVESAIELQGTVKAIAKDDTSLETLIKE